MRQIMVLTVGVIIVGTGLPGCSTNRDDGFGEQLENKADELVGDEEAAYTTFFFPQPPIELDAAGPTPEQLEHLAEADVPMGTHFFVSGQLLTESGSSTGFLEITDMMRVRRHRHSRSVSRLLMTMVSMMSPCLRPQWACVSSQASAQKRSVVCPAVVPIWSNVWWFGNKTMLRL